MSFTARDGVRHCSALPWRLIRGCLTARVTAASARLWRMRYRLGCCAAIACALCCACEPASRSAGRASPASPAASSPTGWTADAERLEVGARGGVGDFFRIIRYSRSAGTLSVDDSDPFAGGREQRPARVVRRSIAVGDRERNAVEAILALVRPDGAALARRCAPGGCLWLALDGGERLEDDATVRPVLLDLSHFFPELRPY